MFLELTCLAVGLSHLCLLLKVIIVEYMIMLTLCVGLAGASWCCSQGLQLTVSRADPGQGRRVGLNLSRMLGVVMAVVVNVAVTVENMLVLIVVKHLESQGLLKLWPTVKLVLRNVKLMKMIWVPLERHLLSTQMVLLLSVCHPRKT